MFDKNKTRQIKSRLTTVLVLIFGSVILNLPITAIADITISGLVEPASVTTGAVSEQVTIGDSGQAGTLTVNNGSSLVVNNVNSVNGNRGIAVWSNLGSLVISNASVDLHARNALDVRNGGNVLVNNGSQVLLNGTPTSRRGLNAGSSPGTSVVSIDGAGTRVDIIGRINLGGFSGGGVGQLALSNDALVVHDGRNSSLFTSFVTGSNGSTGELFIDSGSTIQSIVPLMLVGVGSGTGFVDISNSSLADLTTGLTVGGGGGQAAISVTNSILTVRADPAAPAFLNSGSVLVADLNSATVGTITFDSNAVGDIENNLYISYLGGGTGHGSGQVTVCNSILNVSEVFIGENGALAGTTVNGNITVEGGSIEPGCSPGDMVVDGDVTVIDGELVIEVNGPGVFDSLTVLGTADFSSADASIQLSFGNGYAPSIGDTFDFTAESAGIPDAPPQIDIRPGESNEINIGSNQLLPVAILTTQSSPSFDAAAVDPSTILFGPSGAAPNLKKIKLKDVDFDGDLDLRLWFRIQETGIVCGDGNAELTGQTFEGSAIAATDTINTINCL